MLYFKDQRSLLDRSILVHCQLSNSVYFDILITYMSTSYDFGIKTIKINTKHSMSKNHKLLFKALTT